MKGGEFIGHCVLSVDRPGLWWPPGYGDPFGWFFEDDYFDLLPGETKAVRILGQHSEGRVTAKAWYSPHKTVVEWQANR